jgi:precorrin-2/cobalt-factor-2 C20-methyltransferase
MTVKALKCIQQADYVFVPRPHIQKPGAAETIAAEYLCSKIVVPFEFPMGQENTGRYRQTASLIDETLQDGQTGAFLTIGDPLVNSTYTSIMFETQRLDIQQIIVPGITSYQAAAATLHTPITLKNECFHLADGYIDETILARVNSLCLLKPSKEKANTLKLLEKFGFQYAYVKYCSYPNEEILREPSQILQDNTYMSIIIARKQKARG